MANTIVEFAAYDGQTSVVAYLSPAAGATGSPAASYAVIEVDAGLYRFTAPEALVGLFHLKVLAAGSLMLRGIIRMVDTATTLYPSDSAADTQLLKAELDKVIKTGEEFTTTGDLEAPRTVRFTRGGG